MTRRCFWARCAKSRNAGPRSRGGSYRSSGRSCGSQSSREGRSATRPRDLRGALKAAPPVRHQPALRAADLPEFLAKLESYDGAETTRLGLKLVMLTAVRTREARFATWSEFEGLDGPEPLWRISAERMKMRREHLVPLSTQAVAVLKRLKELAHTARSCSRRRLKRG